MWLGFARQVSGYFQAVKVAWHFSGMLPKSFNNVIVVVILEVVTVFLVKLTNFIFFVFSCQGLGQQRQAVLFLLIPYK